MVTAIFPVKGQPPHIGHILTIVSIYGDYDKIIVHVLEEPGKYYKEENFLIPSKEVVDIFKNIFQYMPKIEVISTKFSLRDKTSFDDFPLFDVIVTGNKDFEKDMKIKKPFRYVPRSMIHGFDISGRLMRKLMRSKGNKSNNIGSILHSRPS
jgi:phosphopantetheine adenylyltransferase